MHDKLFKQKNKKTKKQTLCFRRGSVLLYSILLLAFMLPASIVITDLVRSSMRSSGYSQQGTAAFYAAEAGLESALYDLRKTSAPLSAIDGQTSAADTFFNPAARWTLTAIGTQPNSTIDELRPGETATVEVFDFDNQFAPFASGLTIVWSGSGGEWLELAWTGWDSVGNPTNTTTRRVMSHSESGTVIDLTLGQPNAVAYSVLVKNVSLTQAEVITDIIIEANDANGPVLLPAPVTLISTGRFGQSQQPLRAVFPRRSPLSSLYDYVLFSECTLDKGTGSVECP